MKLWSALALLSVAVWGIEVPNGSFDKGTGEQPDGWQLKESPGGWQTGPNRYVFVRGDGRNMGYWQSPTLPFEPGKLYRVSFLARSPDGSSGTAVTGPVFCNMDIGVPPKDWRRYQGVFVVPDNLSADTSWLRFGQWHVSGEVDFDSVALEEVQAVYSRQGALMLGDGESVSGTDYVFQAPLHGDGRNSSRPLVRAACGFNSNRWTFGANSEVIYAPQVGDRTQVSGQVEVTVGYYKGGQLIVDASADGKTWQPIGSLGEKGTLSETLPTGLYPAKRIWIRLRAQAKGEVGAAQSDPGSFQVHGFTYRATLREPAAAMRGKTRYIAVVKEHPQLKVELFGFGDGIPGGKNAVDIKVTNRGKALTTPCKVSLWRSDETLPKWVGGQDLRLHAGENRVVVPFKIPGTGNWAVTVSLKKGGEYLAKTDLFVPEYYATDYGEVVPGSTDAVALWRASSGWKIPRTRSAPTARADALELAMAQNEVEATQLVVCPRRNLKGLRVVAGDLRRQRSRGPVLPAAAIEVLRVRYVNVERPTDRTGLAAPWPDPLPHLDGPLHLIAGQNQTLWIRVKAPADTPPGIYRGELKLSASGWGASVPLRVRVFGFSLPTRMTCQSAFGFSPGNVYRYQKVTDPAQRREVLAKYWQSFSDHHIAPYDPAPLDRFGVRWPSQGDWQGGRRDTTDKATGKASLLLDDTLDNANVSATFGNMVPIPKKGFRLQFRYRTLTPGHEFLVTFNHHDAAGQWMSGRNNDMHYTGNGNWQSVDRVVDHFPKGAAKIRITLWATLYAEDGHFTGGVRIDDFQLTNLDTGKVVVSGDFEPLPPAALKPTFDWTAWDDAITKAVEHYGFNTFRLPIQGLGGGTFHARREPSLLGYPENTPEYKAAFSAYVQGVESHLREKGWLDEAFVYWFDEPDPKDYAFVMNGFRKLKEYAPGLRRMLTEQVEDELIGGPNLWCPVSSAYQDDISPERMAAGDRFWWYVCTGPKAPYCTLFIDHPGTEMRVWLWQTWKRGIDGILVWQTNYWTSGAAYPDSLQNPYEDPMGWVSGYSTPKGTKRAWGNGDGRFIYPPEAAADGNPAAPVLAGPVDSIRWEMLRDGIEDYEYFAILKRLLAEKGARLPATRRQAYEALLTVPTTVTVTRTDFTTDPAPLEAHRLKLAAAIEDLSK
jgi:hypothetical protein